jgi:hypothetical protein
MPYAAAVGSPSTAWQVATAGPMAAGSTADRSNMFCSKRALVAGKLQHYGRAALQVVRVRLPVGFRSVRYYW